MGIGAVTVAEKKRRSFYRWVELVIDGDICKIKASGGGDD